MNGASKALIYEGSDDLALAGEGGGDGEGTGGVAANDGSWGVGVVFLEMDEGFVQAAHNLGPDGQGGTKIIGVQKAVQAVNRQGRQSAHAQGTEDEHNEE